MLEGIAADTIVAGAYTDGRGGICPMLAAHRHGGRTSFLSFARAWDGFTRTDTVRRVTPRELRVLSELLEASLDEEETDLGAVIAEHREWVARRQLAQPVIRDPAAQASSSTIRSSPSGENGLVRKTSTPAPRARSSTLWSSVPFQPSSQAMSTLMMILSPSVWYLPE